MPCSLSWKIVDFKTIFSSFNLYITLFCSSFSETKVSFYCTSYWFLAWISRLKASRWSEESRKNLNSFWTWPTLIMNPKILYLHPLFEAYICWPSPTPTSIHWQYYHEPCERPPRNFLPVALCSSPFFPPCQASPFKCCYKERAVLYRSYKFYSYNLILNHIMHFAWIRFL